MRVLIGCEYSGVVRDAFLARGHDAMSCDLLPTDVPGPHYQGDLRDVLGEAWDLAIFHPPCTYLTRTGQQWLHRPDDHNPEALKGAPRWEATAEAVEFFQLLLEVDIPRVAIENPRPGSHVVDDIGRPSQVIHPWEFGHPEDKATGLWLKSLPPLMPTDDVRLIAAALPKRERQRTQHLPPSDDRWKLRSATLPGIAEAMAEQWGSL